MNKLYIGSSETASASELLINDFTYIEVILVGDYTAGKNVGSYTIYDWIDNTVIKTQDILGPCNL